MTAFIDAHRDEYGVKPICRVLPIAPSTYHERARQRRDPARLSARAQRDEALRPEVLRVFAENFGVYGPELLNLFSKLFRKRWDEAEAKALVD